MIARKMGKTLVAPLVTLEPGNAGTNIQIGHAGPMLTQATYVAVLYDMGNFLRSAGFTEIYYLGDSGGNGRGMAAAADSLTKVYADRPNESLFQAHPRVLQPHKRRAAVHPERSQDS